ncbi:CRISPR-associated endonuclease Cas2 [Wolinella succinogenes]|uniref:CRISPR-associated endonuclease Cas2 n=1 Tax=Wolinella succinogenes TaxID=844 RepID=UPI002FCAEF6A
MFVILIYDIASREFKEKDNSRRIRKTIEKYLPRVQLSVYEGEIRESDLKKLKSLLQRSADSALDSIILYEFKSLNYSKRTVIGIDKLQAIFD